MTVEVSVIIPTLNEAAYLPPLLQALRGQTRPPCEIIVADADSTDGTKELTQAHGALVVRGGMPAAGRNAGARAATGDVFLFLDADVLPHSNFIERALDEFTRAGYDVATCPSEALGDGFVTQVIVEGTNLYLQAVRSVSPHAPGYCILVRRTMHQSIAGFDESLKLSEDHDYVRRAARCGKFGMLSGVSIPVSMRRLKKDGLVPLAFKYLWCEMHVLANKPVYSTPFEYEFGTHAAPAMTCAPDPGVVGSPQFRRQLDRFENALQRLGQAGLNQLEDLLGLDLEHVSRDRFRHPLDSPDPTALRHDLLARLRRIRTPLRPKHRTPSMAQILPTQQGIHLLNREQGRCVLTSDVFSEEEG